MGMISEEMKAEAIKAALRDMWESGHFSICKFQDCCKIAGVLIPDEIEKFLQPLHCVNFNKMSKGLRKEIMRVTMATIQASPMELDVIQKVRIGGCNEYATFEEIDPETQQPKKTGLRKLLESF